MRRCTVLLLTLQLACTPVDNPAGPQPVNTNNPETQGMDDTNDTRDMQTDTDDTDQDPTRPDDNDDSMTDGGDDGGEDEPEVEVEVDAGPYERPISIIFKVHLEPQAGLAQYRTRRDDVESVRAIAESYGALLTIHGNGEFWEFAAEEGDEPMARAWLDAGHDIGPHMHTTFEHPDGSHVWLNAAGSQQADPEFVADLWRDHQRPLTALLPGQSFNQSTPFNSLDDGIAETMADFGYEIMGGGRQEISVAWFGHQPFHPWRIGQTFLEEDLSAPVVLIPHQPQFGEAEVHGPSGAAAFQDQTLAHQKVQFLQIYLARLEAERTGDPNDRVWVFGFLTHDNESPESTRNDIDSWLSWLTTNFGGDKLSVRGHPIIEFASYNDVYDDFRAWERTHSGISSMHVNTPTPLDASDPTIISQSESRAAYPFPYWGMAQTLRADENGVVDYVAETDQFADDGVTCHELAFGPRDDTTTRDARWLLWRESDAGVTIDVTELVGADTVRRIDAVDGTVTEIDAANVLIAADPVILERVGAQQSP